ncbi:bifunctional nicotinamidase/pyrazinamidase [Halanaerobiaceae bacterium Z-7014]|uniref:nicotinamidase n=1 Tax=Halonatronomonas betaini TaxID=2778430 RepID=A0A931AR74_9FIRM|nr:bifunctional nicotinamidase/pyrazinamidase [Halonatronomonas betaini]MBF8436609.1 bifunctional nicotinamidase/pyrazinamidase [Halonatronomonas betaini]
MNEALICVDLQNDFYEEGALPVAGASQINFTINKMLKEGDFKTIVASQDWHPENHASFASNHDKEPFSPYKGNLEGLGEVLWPDHCVQGTHGAEFHQDIDTDKFDLIIRKGQDLEVDSYSAFRDNDGTDLGLAAYLKGLNIKKIVLVGLALDVCVFYTALDGIKADFDVELILEASKGVNAEENDVENAIDKMIAKGVKVKERYI